MHLSLVQLINNYPAKSQGISKKQNKNKNNNKNKNLGKIPQDWAG